MRRSRSRRRHNLFGICTLAFTTTGNLNMFRLIRFAFGTVPGVRDVGTAQAGALEVNPGQAFGAFNHWTTGKGFTTIAGDLLKRNAVKIRFMISFCFALSTMACAEKSAR